MIKPLVLVTAAMLVPGIAIAAGDANAGKLKSSICAGCHGSKGRSMAPMYPILAGQHAQYLVSALKAYRSQERKGGNSAVMYPMTMGLTDQDIEDLAAFYSKQK